MKILGNKMNKLQCPFTWNQGGLDEEEAIFLRDRLPLAVRPWDSVIKKAQLAFSEFIRGNLDQCRTLVIECYISLLDGEVPGIGVSCDLTRQYRQALKHILDGMWAFVQRQQCDDVCSLEELEKFINNIDPFESMDPKQQAAILAFSSHFFCYPANHMLARKATELFPEEGQWHFYVASMLFDADQGFQSEEDENEREKVFKDILSFNSKCLYLRADAPEPFLLMAKLLTGDEKSSKNSYMLVQNALKKFPDNAYVHDQAADILRTTQDSFGFLPKSYLLIEPFYKKALKLGGECLFVRYKLGFHLVCLSKLQIENYEGAYDEGMENLKKAAFLLPEAQQAFTRFQCKDETIPEIESTRQKLHNQAKIVAAFPELFNVNLSDSEPSGSSCPSPKKKKKKKRKNQ